MKFKTSIHLFSFSQELFRRELSSPKPLTLHVDPGYLSTLPSERWSAHGRWDRIRGAHPALCQLCPDGETVLIVFLTSRWRLGALEVASSAKLQGGLRQWHDKESYLAPGPQYCLAPIGSLIEASREDRTHGGGRCYLDEDEWARILAHLYAGEDQGPLNSFYPRGPELN
jgi:hypothetical protein